MQLLIGAILEKKPEADFERDEHLAVVHIQDVSQVEHADHLDWITQRLLVSLGNEVN